MQHDMMRGFPPPGEAQATLVPNDPLWSREWYARKVRGPKRTV